MFQAPTPSLGWLVDPSDCWISQHLHCVVTDIKDPTRVVAMVEHVVSFLPLHIGEIFRIKIIQFESVHLRTIKDWHSWLFLTSYETLIMTLRVSDWQSRSDLDSIRNSCDIFFYSLTLFWWPGGKPTPRLALNVRQRFESSSLLIRFPSLICHND